MLDSRRCPRQARSGPVGVAVTAHEPHLINAAYSLRAATLHGAKAVHLDGQVGRLKAGMAADLMILDLNEPAFVPLNSAVRQIVYAEAGRAVETVLVAVPLFT